MHLLKNIHSYFAGGVLQALENGCFVRGKMNEFFYPFTSHIYPQGAASEGSFVKFILMLKHATAITYYYYYMLHLCTTKSFMQTRFVENMQHHCYCLPSRRVPKIHSLHIVFFSCVPVTKSKNSMTFYSVFRIRKYFSLIRICGSINLILIRAACYGSGRIRILLLKKMSK